MRQRILAIAKELLSLPTGPFREHHIRSYVKDFCAQRGLAVRQDRVGNVVATYGQQFRSEVFAFEAHMDHPGFIIEQDSKRGRTSARCHGGVNAEYAGDTRIRVFTAAGQVTGRIRALKRGARGRVTRVALDLDGDVQRGDLAIWDLVPHRVRGDRLTSRACDDCVGCVSLLALVDELVRRRVAKKVLCVFTVAEESGLQGVKYLCSKRRIPKRTRIVAVETSSQLPQARIGDGVVIRVGDRRSIFTPAMTAFLADVAESIRRRDRAFRYQRKLMDGGTCESSVYDAFGYTNGALCIPLGNYHNLNPRTKKLAAEYVAVSDLSNMVKLFLGIVRRCDDLPRFLNPPFPSYTEERGPLGETLFQ